MNALFIAASLVLGLQASPSAPPQKPPSPEASPTIEFVLYSDFQCPYCMRFAEPVRVLQAKELDGLKIDVRFKHFPLSIHPAAQLAHQASVAAEAQGKFWEMHDVLFANPSKVARGDLLGYAKQLDLDLARFEKGLDSPETKERIARDIAEGNAARVSGTPSYTINGKLYSGTRTFEQLQSLMGGEQRRARAMAEVHDTTMIRGRQQRG